MCNCPRCIQVDNANGIYYCCHTQNYLYYFKGELKGVSKTSKEIEEYRVHDLRERENMRWGYEYRSFK